MPDQYLLQWGDHLSSIAASFATLREHNQLVDVTLAAGGKSLKAHKVVLCAGSPYFEDLLASNPCKHPIVYMHGMEYDHLHAIVDFMYNGSVLITRDDLDSVLKVGTSLRVRGMTADTEPSELSSTGPRGSTVDVQQVSSGGQKGCSEDKGNGSRVSAHQLPAERLTQVVLVKMEEDGSLTYSGNDDREDTENIDDEVSPRANKRGRLQLRRQKRAHSPTVTAETSQLVKQMSTPVVSSPRAVVGIHKQMSTPVIPDTATGQVFLVGDGSVADAPELEVESTKPPRPILASMPVSSRSGRPHAPQLRDGPAVSCAHCWNTVYSQGRTLRRKTKYMCRGCSVSLCIVPCFQEYHENVSKQLTVTSEFNTAPGTRRVLPKLKSV